MAVETTLAIGDIDRGAEDEGGTLLRYSGGVEGCNQIRRWIFDELPYLAHQLSVFYRQAYLAIP
jgi:hypothetical protein